MTNIKKILLSNTSNKKNNDDEVLLAKNNFDSLFNILLNYNIISTNLEETQDNIYNIQFKQDYTLDEIMKKDIENFLYFLNNTKDNNDNFFYKVLIDFINKQKVYINFEDFLTKEKNTNSIQNCFDTLSNKIIFIEEFNIIQNRIKYFFNCDNYFKQKPSYISINSKKEEETNKEVEEDYIFRKRNLKLLKIEKINELNSLSNVYTKDEIDEKLEECFKKIEQKIDEINKKIDSKGSE